MRITHTAKQATRRRILDAALALFRKQDFDATTTREIALASGIAAGTLFNYFPDKEAIVEALFGEAADRGRRSALENHTAQGLEEQLFALVAAELRQLKPIRALMTSIIERALTPLATAHKSRSQAQRVEHLQSVARLIRSQGLPDPSSVALQLYWTVYVGVLAFWATDDSPRQEDTLALLDDSLNMFIGWLDRQSAPPL